MTIKEFNCSSSRRDYLVKFNNSINDLRLNTVLLESVYSTTIDNFERQRETEREIIRPEQRRKAISIDATVRKITKYLEKGWSQVNNSLVFGGHVLRIIFIWEMAKRAIIMWSFVRLLRLLCAFFGPYSNYADHCVCASCVYFFSAEICIHFIFCMDTSYRGSLTVQKK